MIARAFLSLFGMVFLLADSALAQTLEDEKAPGFYPAIAVEYRHDDNIYRVEDEKAADDITIISPQALYRGVYGKHKLDLRMAADVARYGKQNSEDYDDYLLNGAVDLDLTKRLNVNFRGGYMSAHDPRGAAGTRLDISPEPDFWNEQRAEAEIVYGRRTNPLTLAIAAEGARRRYTNNSQEERDRDVGAASFTLYFNLGPKTSLLTEMGYADIAYVNHTAINLDSAESRYLIGVRWEATAKTAGEIKAGYMTKMMDDRDMEDFGGASVSAEIIWKPRPYSKINLTVSRKTQETPYFYASYYVINRAGLALRHDLSSRLTLTADMSGEIDEYSDGWREEHSNFSAGLSYSLLRWLNIEGRYRRFARVSDWEGMDYETNVFSLRLIAVKI